MILKRTKSLSSPKAAVAWAQSYLDEKAKHKKKPGEAEQKLEDIGMQVGRSYFTTRPVGTLSAHGYVKPIVDRIRVAYGLDETAAALKFIEDYCVAQKRQRRKTLAIRAIASLDPAEVAPYTKEFFDVDHALVRGVEKTFEHISAQYYKGDQLGFLMGIHHDRLSTLDPNPRKPGKAPPNPNRLGKPQLHGHIFILPWTRGGRRISISDHSFPNGMKAPAEDMLYYARTIFLQQAKLSLASLPAPANDIFTAPGWNALGVLSAHQAVIEFRAQPEMTPNSSRQYLIHRFLYHLRSLDREHLKRRLKERADRIKQLAAEKKTIQDAAAYAVDTITSLRPGFEERTRDLRRMRDAYRASMRRPDVSVHLLDTPKAVLGTPPAPNRDFYPELKSLFQTMPLRRKGSRITLLSDMGEADLILASTRSQYPEWMNNLKAAVFGVLPNQQLLNKDQPYPVTVREGMEAVGLPPRAPQLPEGQPPREDPTIDTM
jgi:hypothetical protein